MSQKQHFVTIDYKKKLLKSAKKCYFLCQEIKYKFFLLLYMYPLLFLLKNLLSVTGNQV